MSQTALLVIDLQNDYFPKGKYPLWNTEQTLSNIQNTITLAEERNIPIIIIQHIADASKGMAPFFNKGSSGVEIHDAIKQHIPATVITKSYADSFENTELEKTLQQLGATELLICGMMTQNCVTHTALSKRAEKYNISVLTDCCTSVDKMIHLIALNALSTRVTLTDSKHILKN